MRARTALAAAVAAVVTLTTPTLAQSGAHPRVAPGGDLPVPAVAGHQTLLSWSGQLWLADPGVFTDATGGAYTDSSSAIWVDAANRLHLRILPGATGPNGPSLTALMKPGYGTYRWTVDRSSIAALDPYATLGMFIYSAQQTTASPSSRKREIDIEHTMGAQVKNRTNSQFVVQPYWAPNHQIRFKVTKGSGMLTEQFTWLPGKVSFQTFSGPAPTRRSLISAYSFVGSDVPTTQGTTLRMNLWMFRPAQPLPGYGHDAVLGSFSYTPASGQSLLQQ